MDEKKQTDGTLNPLRQHNILWATVNDVPWDGSKRPVTCQGWDIIIYLGAREWVAHAVTGVMSVELVDGRIVTDRDDVVFVATPEVGLMHE